MAKNRTSGLASGLPEKALVGWSRRMPVRSAAAEAAAEKFFKGMGDGSGVGEHTGRLR